MLLADAVVANEQAIAHATKPQLRKLLPVMRQAEQELSAELGRWLDRQDASDSYDKHRHRALLHQLRGAIHTIETRLAPAWYEDMDEEGERARAAGQSRLQTMVDAGSLEFEGAIRPLRVDVASVMASERKTMLHRSRVQGAGLSRDIVSDINNRLALGVLRGETVDRLTSRLLSSTGLIRVFKERGPNAVAAGAAGRVFNTYRSWAEGIAQTELVNAYSSVQERTLIEANQDDPGWLKKWDAANDARVCPWCKMLDNAIRPADGLFRPVGKFGARPHPPLHSRCRCALVPWRAEWSQFQRGEIRTDEAA